MKVEVDNDIINTYMTIVELCYDMVATASLMMCLGVMFDRSLYLNERVHHVIMKAQRFNSY